MLRHYCRAILSLHQPQISYKFSDIFVNLSNIRFMATSNDKKYDFDYFVIGGGSGGVRSSRIAAQFGARVALAEERKLGQQSFLGFVYIFLNFLGGTCVNVGCVPKKLFCYASHFRELFHDAHAYGWPKTETKLDDHNWKKFIDSKNAEIKRLNEIYEKTQRDNKVTIFKAHASLKDQNTVVVDGKEYTTKYILLAVGGEIVVFLWILKKLIC